MQLSPDEKKERHEVYRKLIAVLNEGDHGDQKAIAESAEISASLLSKFIKGQGRTGTLETARKIAKGLKKMPTPNHADTPTANETPARYGVSGDLLRFIADQIRASLHIIEDPAWGDAKRIEEVGRLAKTFIEARKRFPAFPK